MKVTILKHHEGFTPNEEVDVEEGLAKYWIAIGVATNYEPDNEAIDKTLKANLKKIKKKK